MVVFTCNHCGDSLQKPKVEKHYAFACRNTKSLTCVDCFKDFRGEEYVSHTKCLTEDERYAAKGTFANGIVKKGEVKQESWIEMIKSIIDKEVNLKAPIRNLLNNISAYDNVPRKKPKFINFIKSSSGGRANMKDVEEVWNLIETYKSNQEKSREKAMSLDNVIDNGSKETHTDINDGEKKTKKKKTMKLSEETIQNHHLEGEVKDHMNESSNKPKKKKKQFVTENQVNEPKDSHGTSVTNNIESNTVNETDSTENHIKKKKRKMTEEQTGKTEQEHQTDESFVSNSKSRKGKLKSEELLNVKKSKLDAQNVKNLKQINIDSIEEATQADINEDKDKVKQLKKSKKNQFVTEYPQNGETENHFTNGTDSIQSIYDDGTDGNKNHIKKKKRKMTDEQTENPSDPEHQAGGSVLNILNKFENDNTKCDMENNVKEKGIMETQKKNKKAEVHAKKAKLDDQNEDSCEKTNLDEILTNSKFNFEDKILKILSSKGNISLKKLEKKVINAYLKHCGLSESSTKIMKKFNKKLEKLDNIEIIDENVMLKT